MTGAIALLNGQSITTGYTYDSDQRRVGTLDENPYFLGPEGRHERERGS
ncbi:MAG: hypothetical protein SNJ52_03020 [Verrucomicrobiia bacterium]